MLGHGKDLKRYYEVGQGSDYGPTMGVSRGKLHQKYHLLKHLALGWLH